MTEQLKTTWTAAEIADVVHGVLHGDPAITIDQLSGLDSAEKTELSFLANPKYRKLVSRSKAGIVLLPFDFEGKPPEGTAWIQVDDPNQAFTAIATRMIPPETPAEPGIHASATVAESAEIGKNVSIAPQAVIERGVKLGANTVIGAGVFIGADTTLGEDCKIYSNVSIRERTTIGNRVVIHCNSVIGSDGFGYEPDTSGHHKVPQLGTVQIDDDVEIGACSTVDRARFGKTWIQADVKIDNLCQVAHNVVIGRGSFLMSQSGIAGSTTLGKYVALFGRVAVPGHLHVGDFAKILGGGVPISDVEEGAEIIGFPATDRKEHFRQVAATRRLPNALKQVQSLARRVRDLENRLSDHEGD